MDRPEGLMIAALVAATVALVSAAVIGGRGAEGATEASDVTEDTEESPETVDYEDLGKEPVAGPKTTTGPAATAGPSATKAAAKKVPPTAPRASTQGATRVGVFGDHFEISMHAPITFDGVPLPLADDPVVGVKGYITYINRNGGINGLKVKLQPHDDRYTVAGGQ